MAFRNLIIESPARISVKQSRLIIATDREHAVPMEDISALLLESRQSTISTAALSLLGEQGCCVYFCDEKHLPCAVLLPFSQHSRAPQMLQRQLAMGEPLRKRLWQSIVQAKIRNQARCLVLEGKNGEGLTALAERVRSGDPDNVEATAAARYFPLLFGDEFVRREDEDVRNAALNYGYALLRGCAARNLAVYGFVPSLGLCHHSGVNSFNLADDIMEPFRPLVDLAVSRHVFERDALTPEAKRMLFSLLSMDVLSGGQRHSVAYAMERLVQSLGRSLEEKAPALLLPELQELKLHEYE